MPKTMLVKVEKSVETTTSSTSALCCLVYGVWAVMGSKSKFIRWCFCFHATCVVHVQTRSKTATRHTERHRAQTGAVRPAVLRVVQTPAEWSCSMATGAAVHQPSPARWTAYRCQSRWRRPRWQQTCCFAMTCGLLCGERVTPRQTRRCEGSHKEGMGKQQHFPTATTSSAAPMSVVDAPALSSRTSPRMVNVSVMVNST